MLSPADEVQEQIRYLNKYRLRDQRGRYGEYKRWGHLFKVNIQTHNRGPGLQVYTPHPALVLVAPWIFDTGRWDYELIQSFDALTNSFAGVWPYPWQFAAATLERCAKDKGNYFGVILPKRNQDALALWIHKQWIQADRHIPKFFNALEPFLIQPISQQGNTTELINDEHSGIYPSS